VLGRTVVLRGSSGCLNTGSCSFLLVGARETRELVLPSSWCQRNQGVGSSFYLVLDKQGLGASF
jgi:hypothetical protein